ncbi:response regulator [Paraburkholderia sp. LEh10]|uniref:ATP-binding protein n=1 Tax=Paraburkholderia sp. LEh10 TaxID=2821353 RepID=UPI001AE80062|nr:ATP-binding protein [Paraburkholderia sp. LEh10]MBP0592745.1 response regulator [Paraburkholderia sp. LEh10]
MQNLLDRTQESLAEGFARLSRYARRQRRVYIATIVLLLVILAVSASLLAGLAIGKYVDYMRSIRAQDAANFSVALHNAESFLRRTELTVDYYETTKDVQSVPPEVEQAVRASGVAAGSAPTADKRYDLLVSDATQKAWGDDLNAQLWRLSSVATSTLVTREAFDVPYRTLMVGLTDDYAVLMPGLSQQNDPGAPPLAPALIGQLRATMERNLLAQSGARAPAKGTYVLSAPYHDPLLGVPAIMAITAHYAGDTPVALIAIVKPLDQFFTFPVRSPHDGLVMLVGKRGVIKELPPVDAATAREFMRRAALIPHDTSRYSLDGVLFSVPVSNAVPSLVSHLSWGDIVGALRWQLGAIVGVTLLAALAVILTAKYWGLALLRRSNEEAVRALESETINHILVAATPVGLCIVRQRDFHILTSNQLARELLHLGDAPSGLPAHIGAAFKERNAHEAGASRLGKFAEFIVPALPVEPADADKPDTQYLQISYGAARYRGEDVLFCALLDVTVRHALGRQIRAAQSETEAMMKAQTSFFAAMSHEIRTPLNALLGNLELLSLTPGLDAHHQRLRAVGAAADGLRHIVNDILDFSKIGAGKMKLLPESFRPIEDLENLALSYAPLTSARPLRFYAHLSPSLYRTVRGDRTRVVQIVNNLLSNAFKFTPSGKITLTANVEPDLHDRPVLMCRVIDSGIGMDSSLVARIFNPFVQAESNTSSRYGGTGLGLSICARLCELMGGKIGVESVPGLGSAFTVSIPLEPTAEALAAASAEPPQQRGSALVLCQEAASAKVLDEMLAYVGWSASSAASVAAAEAWLRARRPGFVIVTGEYDLETVKALRAIRPVDVVWLTRSGQHQPTMRADGVYEVTEFSHDAIFACIGQLTGGVPSFEAPPAAAAWDERAADPSLQGLRVLVAEDNPLNQTLITEQLTALGCEPVLADNGREALALLRQTGVDLVLTDIHMPIMDGYALIEALRQSHPHLPVLAFSAVTAAEQIDEWRRRGFTAFVPKPASLKQVATALQGLRLRARAEGAEAAEGAEGAEGPERGSESVSAIEADRVDADSARAATVADAEPEPEPQTERGKPVPRGTPSDTQALPDTAPSLDPADKARFMQMLKDYLMTDLPRLASIIESRDVTALREWAHGAAGGFLVAQEAAFAAQCRELQYLCEGQPQWTPAHAARAAALHDHLRSAFALDVASIQ